MKEQSAKHHTRIVYPYYIMTGFPIIALLVYSLVVLWRGEGGPRWAWASLLAGWILLTLLFRARSFALKAQDRAIRAEESLRYFILTGKRIDGRITIRQIIALRFASDEEFPGLVHRAAEENLSPRDIKFAIR